MPPKNPSTNLLKALMNAKSSATNNLSKSHTSPKSTPTTVNRVTTGGNVLEEYTRNIFCGRYPISDARNKQTAYSANFSYLGNQNNPPDIIIKNGDAFEIKDTKRRSLALKGSLPNDKLRAEDGRISDACRNCEELPWKAKDLFYVFGNAKKGVLKNLFFIHGTCCAADPAVYDNFVWETKVKKNDVVFSVSSRIHKTKSPLKLVKNLVKLNNKTEFQVVAIMKKEKYLSYPLADRRRLESISNGNMSIGEVMLPDPNKSKEYIAAKLINYSI